MLNCFHRNDRSGPMGTTVTEQGLLEWGQGMNSEGQYDEIGCVILASGLGKRFGGNKLMADFHGHPMIGCVLDATEGMFRHRVVVTRHEEVAEYCRRRGTDVVLHHLSGRNDTVRLGLEALIGSDHGQISYEKDTVYFKSETTRISGGCLFCPGDQPLLRKETVASLADCGRKDRTAIWRPAFGDVAGAPVLFPSLDFPELLTLPEGKGGSYIIKRNPQRVRLLPVGDPYELRDADTPAELNDLRSVKWLRQGT